MFVGDYVKPSIEGEKPSFANYFRAGCHPSPASSHVVHSVEKKLQHHLDLNSLGSPYHPLMSVKEVLDKLTINQGAFLMGSTSVAVEGADRPTSASSSHSAAKVTEEVVKTRLQKELVSGICDTIEKMLLEMKTKNASSPTVPASTFDSVETIMEPPLPSVIIISKQGSQDDEKSLLIRALQEENNRLKLQLQQLLSGSKCIGLVM